MPQPRPFILSLAGFDPSGGAGIIADMKTFENHQVYGIGVLTANTIQTEDSFIDIRWEKRDYILHQLENILQRYQPQVIKVGIVASGIELLHYIDVIKRYTPQAFIVWDPVLRSSTQFDFTAHIDQPTLLSILNQIDLVTPNYMEIDRLITTRATPIEKAESLRGVCAVLLKGGHHPKTKAMDQLFTAEEIHTFYPQQVFSSTKHGTGCILSAAIGSYIALEYPLFQAVRKAKKYVEHILSSNSSLLAYHV
ncbi:hydroxymethylpyrimidine/phosphomethylpyrimidine kinase [Myroides sp. DW712]|uniref:hydroxymethylpyrimidine/phosphomethylpyrimidine kinase n=1 Tax=Myroides sp. DW712 TaxID=3389800 RepID=UPI003978C0EF